VQAAPHGRDALAQAFTSASQAARNAGSVSTRLTMPAAWIGGLE